jgi:hypothetical protein
MLVYKNQKVDLHTEERLQNMKKLVLGSLIATVMVCYFLYAIKEKGIWAGMFFVLVSFLALLYHILRSRNKTQ